MSDLTERLRAKRPCCPDGPSMGFMHEAADRIDTLETALREAVAELDGTHTLDRIADSIARRQWCATCGTADGSWPCTTRQVADDLRAALGDDS